MGAPTNTDSSPSTPKPAPPKRSRAQPTADSQTQFLYLILKQLDLKSVNWQEVADGIGIKNGHAARMRWSRFKAQTEGLPTQSQKKQQKKKDCEGKDMSSCKDPNKDAAGAGGYYGSFSKRGYEKNMEAAMADDGGGVGMGPKRVKLEHGGYGPPPPYPGTSAPWGGHPQQPYMNQPAPGYWGPPPPPKTVIKSEPGLNIKQEGDFSMLQQRPPVPNVPYPWLGPPPPPPPAGTAPMQMPNGFMPPPTSFNAGGSHAAGTDPDDLPIRQTQINNQLSAGTIENQSSFTALPSPAATPKPVEVQTMAEASKPCDAAAATSDNAMIVDTPVANESIVPAAKTLSETVFLSAIPKYDGDDRNEDRSREVLSEAGGEESGKTGEATSALLMSPQPNQINCATQQEVLAPVSSKPDTPMPPQTASNPPPTTPSSASTPSAQPPPILIPQSVADHAASSTQFDPNNNVPAHVPHPSSHVQQQHRNTYYHQPSSGAFGPPPPLPNWNGNGNASTGIFNNALHFSNFTDTNHLSYPMIKPMEMNSIYHQSISNGGGMFDHSWITSMGSNYSNVPPFGFQYHPSPMGPYFPLQAPQPQQGLTGQNFNAHGVSSGISNAVFQAPFSAPMAATMGGAGGFVEEEESFTAQLESNGHGQNGFGGHANDVEMGGTAVDTITDSGSANPSVPASASDDAAVEVDAMVSTRSLDVDKSNAAQQQGSNISTVAPVIVKEGMKEGSDTCGGDSSPVGIKGTNMLSTPAVGTEQKHTDTPTAVSEPSKGHAGKVVGEKANDLATTDEVTVMDTPQSGAAMDGHA